MNMDDILRTIKQLVDYAKDYAQARHRLTTRQATLLVMNPCIGPSMDTYGQKAISDPEMLKALVERDFDSPALRELNAYIDSCVRTRLEDEAATLRFLKETNSPGLRQLETTGCLSVVLLILSLPGFFVALLVMALKIL